MAAFTTVPTVVAGEIITALDTNTFGTAIGELQTCATRANYDQTKTSYSWTSNAAEQDFTSWSSSAGYTASGTGLNVPADGVYIVTMHGTLSAGSFAAATRYYFKATDSTGEFMRGTAVPGVSETVLCVTGVTRYMTAGTKITPYRFQNTGSSITLSTMRLIIARVPVGG